jgi:hypothetical protein
VAWSSEHATLRRELLAVRSDILRGSVYHEQWDDDDFQPIAAAIDTVLRQRGWRR